MIYLYIFFPKSKLNFNISEHQNNFQNQSQILCREKGVKLHLVASISAAFAATTASQPADLIKSRMMSDKDCKFRGTFDCIKYTFRHDGFLGFFRGWTPSFARLCPHFCVSLPLFEQTRKLLGLSYL